MVYNVELVLVISLLNLVDKAVELKESPLVDCGDLVKRYHIGIGVKIREVAENVSCGISDFSVRFRSLFKNIKGDVNI